MVVLVCYPGVLILKDFYELCFFVSVFASLFLEKKKYIFLAVSLGLVGLLHLVFRVWESLIIFIVTVAGTQNLGH